MAIGIFKPKINTFSKITNSNEPNKTLSASKWTLRANKFVNNKPNANKPEKKTPITDCDLLRLDLDKNDTNQTNNEEKKTDINTKKIEFKDPTSKKTKTNTGRTE